MRSLLARFKRTRPEPDDEGGMISSTAAKDAFRQSAIRFLACIAALAATGLALVITHPAWWPVSVVTAASIPLIYHLAGMGRLRGSSIGAFSVLERLVRAGCAVWHDVAVGDQTISHVVVGATGVFAVSRVTWAGSFTSDADGSLRHSGNDAGGLVWKASKDAAAIKARLRTAGLRRVPVHAVIAATRAGTEEGPIEVGQAVLVRMADLPTYVLSGPSSLGPEQVARAIAAFEGEEPTERSRPGRG
jgi:hypothetical protein